MSIVNGFTIGNSDTGENNSLSYASQKRFNGQLVTAINRLNDNGVNQNTVITDINTAIDNLILATQTTVINIDDDTETSIFTDDIGDKTLIAGFFTVGSNTTLNLFGEITTDASAGTLIIKVKVGSVTLLTSATSTLPNSLTTKLFLAQINISCITVGVTGTLLCHGFIQIDNGSNGFYTIPLVTTSAKTVDTTISNELDVTATMSLASGNSLNINYGQLKSL